MSDVFDIVQSFIPSHKRDEIRDRLVDTLTSVFPNESWRKLIQVYRSDAEFREDLALALERAVQMFTLEWKDKELVDAITQNTRFWDIPNVQTALQEMVTRPSSYLQQERQVLLHSFTDVLPTVEPERVERAVVFFFHCLTREVINIPQLAPIYQVQLQWASLEQTHQLVNLQRGHNQLITQLIENQLLLAAPVQSVTSSLPKVRHNLPSQYGEFLGREKDLKLVADALKSRWPLISIEGMGGIGKTRLAIEIAYSCLLGQRVVFDPLFEYVVWVSAQDRPEQQLWLNEVLDITARTLGYPSIAQLPAEQIEQKKTDISQLLSSFRSLVIVDNFETIKDSALESWIQSVPEPSKVLITSRYDQLRRALPIKLKGLEEPEALEFIRRHAQRLRLQSIEEAKDETLLPLVRVTGGNPKAIELALGHITRGISLMDIVEHLHVASKTTNDVFAQLFSKAWTLMRGDAQAVLQITTFFANPASREALGAASGLTDFYLDAAIEELVELMLLDIHEEMATSSYRYSTHPLTRAFAHAQLQNAQEFEKQARKRWSKYYLDFAASNLIREQPGERYWNALVSDKMIYIDAEWPSILEVLTWVIQEEQDQLILDFVMLLVHYMDSRFLNLERLTYVNRAVEAARKMDRKEDEALLRIDALGWTYVEEDRLEEAYREIVAGLEIARQIRNENENATQLLALGLAWQARVMIEQGRSTEASQLINEALAIPCKPWIKFRVNLAAGDIALKQGNGLEALRFYEDAAQASQEYGGEGRGYQTEPRIGLAYLAKGKPEEAEAKFQALHNLEQIAIGKLYAEYGLALVAYERGETPKAKLFVETVRKELSRRTTSNLLLKLINKLFEDIEAGRTPLSGSQT